MISDAFIGQNHHTLRGNLARVLDMHTLPPAEGPLVVVTEGVAPEVLEQAGVWRSLTDRYAADDGDAPQVWQPILGRRLNLSRRDLRGVDLKHISLRGADLTYADLTARDLEGADLREADLRHANLSETSLCRANLSGADLRHANLYGADLRSADLSGANLWWAKLNGAVYNPETRWSFIHRMLSGAVQKYR
ncbi:MAG: pentapeptide repeat-containing protein [Chloroflexaceae bacterium]|nr:pentapeptide repeat-containing protein [Chloroflexaceae bacterium]